MPLEVLARLRALRRGELRPRREVHALLDQALAQLREALGASQQHRVQRVAQPVDVRVELLDHGQVAAGVGARAHGADALHEELVEVGGEDRQELEPLEQRHAFVERLGQHPAIELEPAQVPVEPGVLEHPRAQFHVHIDPGIVPRLPAGGVRDRCVEHIE